MKKDNVIFKNFGKNTTDTENRDEKLKAYVCAILDVPDSQFDDVFKDITSEQNKKAFIKMIFNDIEARINRFLENCNEVLTD